MCFFISCKKLSSFGASKFKSNSLNISKNSFSLPLSSLLVTLLLLSCKPLYSSEEIALTSFVEILFPTKFIVCY